MCSFGLRDEEKQFSTYRSHLKTASEQRPKQNRPFPRPLKSRLIFRDFRTSSEIATADFQDFFGEVFNAPGKARVS